MDDQTKLQIATNVYKNPDFIMRYSYKEEKLDEKDEKANVERLVSLLSRNPSVFLGELHQQILTYK